MENVGHQWRLKWQSMVCPWIQGKLQIYKPIKYRYTMRERDIHTCVYIYIYVYMYRVQSIELPHILLVPVCTPQGGGGSFKDSKLQEVGCCESCIAEQIH